MGKKIDHDTVDKTKYDQIFIYNIWKAVMQIILCKNYTSIVFLCKTRIYNILLENYACLEISQLLTSIYKASKLSNFKESIEKFIVSYKCAMQI